jgi:hypothetical protein
MKNVKAVAVAAVAAAKESALWRQDATERTYW